MKRENKIESIVNDLDIGGITMYESKKATNGRQLSSPTKDYSNPK